MPFFGAHMSVAGGTANAFTHIQEASGEAVQIFTRNQRQWAHKPVTAEEARLFRAARKMWGGEAVVSHASYLLNLAGPAEESFKKSTVGLAQELLRCALLDVPLVVLHPGSHLGSGVDAGCQRVAEGLECAYEQAALLVENACEGGLNITPQDVTVLLENMAGQGKTVGGKFTELGKMISSCSVADRLGICLDTCHAFSAGYDFRTEAGYREMMQEISEEIGMERLRCVHLNDSMHPCGAHLDRHQHIGRGEIGLDGFRQIVTDPVLRDVPMIIETPKENGLDMDRENLRILRSLCE